MPVMNPSNEFQNYTYTLPPNRQLLAAKLMEKNWFKNTDLSIQKSILSLPDDFEGFVFDLSNRPDHLGNLEIVRLQKLVSGHELITPVFEVYSQDTQKTFTKEYVSWKIGRYPGAKGILFIEMQGKITHFITIETPKFPIGEFTHDALGGIYQYSKEDIADLPAQIKKIVKTKLGLKTLNIKRLIDLGRIFSDNGLTINNPNIFAAIIDGQEAKIISKINKSDIQREVLEYKINIVPIEQLDMYIAKIDDVFFLSIISRLLAKRIISL